MSAKTNRLRAEVQRCRDRIQRLEDELDRARAHVVVRMERRSDTAQPPRPTLFLTPDLWAETLGLCDRPIDENVPVIKLAVPTPLHHPVMRESMPRRFEPSTPPTATFVEREFTLGSPREGRVFRGWVPRFKLVLVDDETFASLPSPLC